MLFSVGPPTLRRSEYRASAKSDRPAAGAFSDLAQQIAVRVREHIWRARWGRAQGASCVQQTKCEGVGAKVGTRRASIYLHAVVRRIQIRTSPESTPLDTQVNSGARWPTQVPPPITSPGADLVTAVADWSSETIVYVNNRGRASPFCVKPDRCVLARSHLANGLSSPGQDRPFASLTSWTTETYVGDRWPS